MSKIFDQLVVANITFNNRLVMSPMCMYASDESGEVKDFHLLHYETRAMGGVGAITVEATAVEKHGVISARDLGIWSDSHVAGLQRLTQCVRRHGVPIGIQLAHAGRKCVATGRRLVSASAIAFDEKSETPEALAMDELPDVAASFAAAAKRAVLAGFGYVEIHAAHGYLINQFMSSLVNHRTDEYGGSIVNRTRLLKDVIIAVRAAIPREMMLSVRVSAEEYAGSGNHPADVAVMLNEVKTLGVDIVNVSSGGVINASVGAFPGYQIEMARVVKEITGLPVIGGGLITDKHLAEEIIGNRHADLIFLGRQLLSDPYCPLKWAAASGRKDLVPENYIRAF